MSRRLCAAAMGWLALAAAVVATAEPIPDAPASELLPGTRGTVVSSLDGDLKEQIPFRYLGTLEDFAGPGYDLYLVQLEGPTAERVGVANGLSGSPAYVDGRLIGALSYRIGRFPKEPVAGITPIEAMLAASGADGRRAGASEDGIEPIGTPVVAVGLLEPARQWLATRLDGLGLVLAAGGGSGGPDGATPLAPGSAVGVQLVSGDLRIGATGTVTHVQGDAVYAFGHPFLGIGDVDLPMASARVIHALGDLSGGSLLAAIGEPVGAIRRDTLTGIVGSVGAEAATIPLLVQVRGGNYGQQRFEYRVARQPELAPLFLAVTAANSLLASTGYTPRSTIHARGTVRLEGLPDIPLEMAYAADDGRDPAISVASELFGILGLLTDNPFEEIRVTGIDLEIDAESEVTAYRVESVRYDRGTLQPGKPLHVVCALRAFRGETILREFELDLPEQLPPSGSLVVAVGDPQGIDLAMGAPLDQRARSSPDVASLVRVLGERRASHRLTAVVYEPGGAVVSRGLALTELPPTAQKLLSLQAERSRGKSLALVSPIVRIEQALDGPVRGGKQLRLRVERGTPSEENR